MQAILIRHVFALGFSFLLGLYLVPIIIRAAKKIGFMDVPDGRLKHQKKPVAYLGGLAIFISFISTLGLCYPFENQALWLLLGTTLLLFIGLIDDLKVLRPSQKFFGQFIAVLCFLKGEFSLKTLYFSSFFNIALSGFWMLSIINAFNLVDVMDGLCATLALVSAITFALIAFWAGKYTTSVLLLAFIGSLAAFLVYNKPQAKIYLGDAGSLFIGGFLSVMPLLFDWDKTRFTWGNSYPSYTYIDQCVKPLFELFFIPAIILGVPLLEVFSLFIIRTYHKIPFYKGSPHHFSIYLQKKGWSRVQTLLFTALTSAIFSCGAILFLYRLITFTQVLYIGVVCVFSWIYIIFFHKNYSIKNIYSALLSTVVIYKKR